MLTTEVQRSEARGMGRERAGLLALCGLAALGCLLGLVSPPTAGVDEGLAQQALDLIRVITTTALAVVLMLGPGIAWRASRPGCRRELGFLPLPGLALLVCTGSVAWALAGEVSPRAVCAFVLIPVLGCLLAGILRAGTDEILEGEERRALLLVGLVLGLAIARSLWSLGPAGELYGGTISRTLEVGDRSDSRIPFHVVQLLSLGHSPYGAQAASYFSPFTFSHRGPLPGIASAPVVLLAGGQPPERMPDLPWSPFDGQGFMAYRLAMMALASTAFLSLWTLTRCLGGHQAARLALLLAATTPFLVHEVWFTWPKLAAASFVFLAAVSLIQKRPLLAGLLVATGYLFHPLALLSVPALVLMALWPFVGSRMWHPSLPSALCVLGGAAVGPVAWRFVNGSHYAQDTFVDYLTAAAPSDPVTLPAWLSHRIESLVNTLVPLRLFIFSADDPWLNVVGGQSPPIVHFFLQYWTALPFGVSILFLPLLLASLWRAARRWVWPFVVGIVTPFVVFTVYWGSASTGMLREGLHVWILTLFVVVAVEQEYQRFEWLRSKPIRVLLALRSLEVLLVAVLPTVVTRERVYDERFVLTDTVALVALFIFCAGLCSLVWRQQPQLRSPCPPTKEI
jgi:hypothetical protein